MDEVAARVKDIIARHGPESVALYLGTHPINYIAGALVSGAWLSALNSPMFYTSGTVDQPGKDIAWGLLGGWEAGTHGIAEFDVFMLVGANPLVSWAASMPVQNPGHLMKEALNRGMKLIVIDPRKSQTAARAHIHMQPRPGQDTSIIAGMIRIILAESLHDHEFIAENVIGFDALRSAVAPFTPEYVAERAGIPASQLIEAARMFAMCRRGFAVGATGFNMSGRSSLNEYLLLCMNTICGRFLREGEAVTNPGVLMPRAMPRAQPTAPRPVLFPEAARSVRGLSLSVCGMPTAAMSEEILNGRIRALFSVGGNPATAWPDQNHTISALKALELFVQVDIKMSASAKLAHYVIPTKISIETPAMSYVPECLEFFTPVMTSPEPFGLYAPALLDAPAGSDLLEEWEFFYGLAQRMSLALELGFTNFVSTMPRRVTRPPIKLDMQIKPTTDDIYEYITRGSRIPLAEVKKYPDGALFPETIVAAPKDPDCTARLDVGNADLMAELSEVAAERAIVIREFPYSLIGRRVAHAYNSTGRDLPSLIRKGGSYNPTFIHPSDLKELGIQSGEVIDVTSRHGSVQSIAKADDTLRPGVVAMTHSFGDLPEDSRDYRRVGSNSSQLTSVLDDFDRFTGMPRMSAVPVRITARNHAPGLAHTLA
jgi:anaerobic selenocysteine-containing dehydrogenase